VAWSVSPYWLLLEKKNGGREKDIIRRLRGGKKGTEEAAGVLQIRRSRHGDY